MKAEAANLLRFLQIGKQCLIPIYQRTYSWTEDQCEILWQDILKVGANSAIPGHFVGSFVYVQDAQAQVLSATPQCMVIDGQQRMTTISLLLLAFANAIEKTGTDLVINDQLKISANYIRNNYLLNSNEEGEKRFKLILTQADKDTYLSLLQKLPAPTESSKRIQENYEFFEDKLEKTDLVNVYIGIQKLMIVEISLDRTYDNPQLIFESLNSTGLELSQADLIRNYILMGLEPQKQDRIYREFWFPMEKRFGHSEYSSYFDRFMRDYLTLKLNRIPKINQVYEEFKEMATSGKFQSVDELVADVFRYSEFFVNMVLGKEVDAKLSKRFDDLNQLKVDVVYPFLLDVYSDYKLGRLNHDDFLEIVDLLESYVFRRAICGIPTNSMNKTFANLYKEIDTSDYLNSFKAALLLKDSYRRFPADEEFMRELKVKDVYNFRNKNYLLVKIENSRHPKEVVDVGQYSIEHILPQNEKLSSEWVEDLGPDWKEIQTQYLHTLGNLTLTGYNTELSDKPFAVKRDMEKGFKSSPLYLNQPLRDLAKWTPAEIISRAENLASVSAEVWLYPELPGALLDKYKALKSTAEVVSEYALSDHPYLVGPMMDLFETLSKEILDISPSVSREIKKLYIAFKSDSNFVDIVPQKSRLRLSLNCDIQDLNDPKGMCEDVSGKGRWGNGNTQVSIYKADELDDVINLIKQAYTISLSE